jgi:hypothetical protein
MVRGQNGPGPERPRAISDCFVARGPRRRFKTIALLLPCADANLQRLANHTTRLGKRPTVLRPRIGSGLQAVMDVNGVQRPVIRPMLGTILWTRLRPTRP